MADGADIEDGPGRSTDGSRIAPTPAGRNRVRNALAIVLIAALIGVVAVVAWPRWQGRDYIGTSRPVTLVWPCANHITWTSPDGVVWLVENTPASYGTVQTIASGATQSSGSPTHQVSGTLRFDSYDGATFTADTGGRWHLARQPKGRFYTMECAID